MNKYRRADDGTVTLFVVAIFVAVLAAIGLVVDGDTKIRAAREATAIAEEAARAGAGHINVDHAYARGGHFTIDDHAAISAAHVYLTTTGHTGTVSTIGPRQIRVTVTISKRTAFLDLIGITEVRATKTVTASLVSGINGAAR